MSSLQPASFPLAQLDLTKAWISFKSPSLNMGTLLEAHRKNAAALTTANQIVFDGLRALAERHGDLIKTAVDDYGKIASDVLAAPSVEEKATKQADAAQHLYASAVARFRELSDIALTANVAVADILNARITEAFDEVKALFAAPVPTAAASSAAPATVIAEPVDVADEVAPVEVVVAAEAPQAPPAPVEPEPTPDPTVTVAPKTNAPAPKTSRRPTSRR